MPFARDNPQMTPQGRLLNILVVVVICTPTCWSGVTKAVAFEKGRSNNSSLQVDGGSASGERRFDDSVCPPCRK